MGGIILLKKMDKFVFYTTLLSWLSLLLLLAIAINTHDKWLFRNAEHVSIPFGIAIFINFMNDKDFKILYYIGYILASSVINNIFQVISLSFIDGLASIMVLFLALGIISAFINGYLYELFKQKSYAKNREL